INCAHDDEKAWAAMVSHARNAQRVLGRRVKILMDIAGPKCRTAEVTAAADRKRLLAGDRVLLCRSATTMDGHFEIRATCTIPEVIDRLTVGDRVYVDDGRYAGHIEAIEKAGAVLLIERTKINGGKLKSAKGLNFPDTDLGLSPLTKKDLADLDF